MEPSPSRTPKLDELRKIANVFQMDDEVVEKLDDLEVDAEFDRLLTWISTLFFEARLEASAERRRRALESDPTTLLVTPGEILARTLKRYREESGRTQAELAVDMERIGFVTWKRITVAETESGKRRPTWEELLGFAALYGVRVTDLLGQINDEETLTLNESRTANAATVRELVGPPSESPDLEPGAMILGIEPGSADDWRPAIHLHHTNEGDDQ